MSLRIMWTVVIIAFRKSDFSDSPDVTINTANFQTSMRSCVPQSLNTSTIMSLKWLSKFFFIFIAFQRIISKNLAKLLQFQIC